MISILDFIRHIYLACFFLGALPHPFVLCKSSNILYVQHSDNLGPDSHPCTQATSPCTNDARANMPALTAIPTSASCEQMPTPMPRTGEKKSSRISSQATLALSMTRLTTMTSGSSCSVQLLMNLPSGEEPILVTSRG